MNLARSLGLLLLSLAAASGLGAVERVEIVIDNSAGMWRTLGQGPPQFVGVRAALLDYAAASNHRQGRPEIALRAMGGGQDRATGEMCEDTALLQNFDLADPQRWFEALSELVPHGGRPLAAALREATADLGGATDRRRLVLIVSGGDDCQGDVAGAIEAITTAEPKIDLRIIGLGLDRDTITAAGQLAPTRNLNDTSALGAALEWALEPSDSRPAVPVPFDITLSLGGTPANRSEIALFGPQVGEPVRAVVKNGQARIRTVPGRYRAEVRGVGTSHELAGLALTASGERVALDLVVGPPATLEVAPEAPAAGGGAWVRTWGVPVGGGWVAVSTPGAPPDAFLLLIPVQGGTTEVWASLPDVPQTLELQVLVEAAPGVLQVLGRTPLETVRPAVRIDAPDRVEARTPITLAWSGPGHRGDIITVVPEGAAPGSHVVCVAADAAEATVTVPAPVVPGRYLVQFVSSWGRVLERQPLEVFEVLATLDVAKQASPSVELAIGWTGPDGPHDFLSIAPAEAENQDYISWEPTSSGSPLELQTPSAAGTYEVRYVRGLDGEVLAREALEIVHTAIRVEAPETVDAGTRFPVTWHGTSAAGDLIAVARVGAAAGRWFDFAYVGGEHSLTLAAPFKPGQYELRYISGAGLEVLDAQPLLVR
jgi:Ca-activated chloride channel family protein